MCSRPERPYAQGGGGGGGGGGGDGVVGGR